MSAELKVEHGRIVVNDVWPVIDNSDVKVWHIDLRTKYAEILSYSYGFEDEMSVTLTAGESTLKVDETTDKFTVLSWEHPKGERWDILADIGRYTVTVVVYRLSKPRRFSWLRGGRK